MSGGTWIVGVLECGARCAAFFSDEIVVTRAGERHVGCAIERISLAIVCDSAAVISVLTPVQGCSCDRAALALFLKANLDKKEIKPAQKGRDCRVQKT